MAVGGVLVVIAGGALGLGMLAFSAIAWLAAVSLLVLGLSSFAYRVRSDFVLPVWQYSARTDSFSEANTPVLTAGAGVLVILLWGAATAYTELMTTGVAVTGFAISLLYMYATRASDPAGASHAAPQHPAHPAPPPATPPGTRCTRFIPTSSRCPPSAPTSRPRWSHKPSTYPRAARHSPPPRSLLPTFSRGRRRRRRAARRRATAG